LPPVARIKVEGVVVQPAPDADSTGAWIWSKSRIHSGAPYPATRWCVVGFDGCGVEVGIGEGHIPPTGEQPSYADPHTAVGRQGEFSDIAFDVCVGIGIKDSIIEAVLPRRPLQVVHRDEPCRANARIGILTDAAATTLVFKRFEAVSECGVLSVNLLETRGNGRQTG